MKTAGIIDQALRNLKGRVEKLSNRKFRQAREAGGAVIWGGFSFF